MKKNIVLPIWIIVILLTSCTKKEAPVTDPQSAIMGFNLLSNLSGHWVGSNQTAFGLYDWFSFDFRPISAAHIHSIYEGGTNQNIITSVFIADFEGKQQVMARNGGWLGNQYRATYFVLDIAREEGDEKFYRLVDAIGKEDRAYMEFRFVNDSLYFDAYKDNSGTLDKPIHHMGFKGSNFNPSFALLATTLFNFPQPISEVDLTNEFNHLIDSNSALFLEEANDPFPKSAHGHISDLTISINRAASIEETRLLLYISTAPIVDENVRVDFQAINEKVVRTIDVEWSEESYTATYLHPDQYYITLFYDQDQNQYPSSGDICSISQQIDVAPESPHTLDIDVDIALE